MSASGQASIDWNFDIVMLMMIALLAFGLCCLLEMLIYLSSIWPYRVVISKALIPLIIASNIIIIVSYSYLWGIVLAFISCYRIINLLRVISGKVQFHHLFHISRNTSTWLIAYQLLVLLTAWISDQFILDFSIWLVVIVIAQLIVATLLLFTTTRNIASIKLNRITSRLEHKDLPSVTVAIPARNETADLEACLLSILASDYPKLEILVLDDCSQDKHTPEIIKSFAHAGVRFLAGESPPQHWLAKNYAYEQLANAASGEVLLFCGVDTRFNVSSITNIANMLTVSNHDMLSILPSNHLPKNPKLANYMLQPSRYAWEIAVPRRFFEKPPALSTCWLIKHSSLDNAGGFDAVRQTVSPERYFSKYTALTGNGYSFVSSDDNIGIRCVKSIDEQRSTSIRTRYPQLHKRPEFVSIVSAAEFMFLFAPFLLAIYMLITQNWLLGSLAIITSLVQSFVYAKVVNLTYRKQLILGLFVLPAASLYDIGILNISMLKYEFGSVLWKGRDVTVPVMHLFVVGDQNRKS